MSKILIIGGTSGIGLAMACELAKDINNKVIISGRKKPLIAEDLNLEFIECDLFKNSLSIFKEQTDVDELIITAGMGRLSKFEGFSLVEIRKTMTVNTTAIMEILTMFKGKLLGASEFKCAVVTSISGIIASPLLSVYSASKAALCKYIEAVNAELEMSGSNNMITNIAPGYIKNTSFEGGETKIELLGEIAQDFLRVIDAKQKLYIPGYDDIYKNVIDRYNKDPEKFAKESYEYKVNSGRIDENPKVKIGYLSGTFDLFHVGHLNLIQRARKYCDYLIVGIHKDASHKGKITFIPFEERMRVVGALGIVDKVVECLPEDSDAWDLYHYDLLFVGSDYKGTERFNRYEEYFKDKGVEIIYFPYTQGTSSTQLRNALQALSEYGELRSKELGK